MTKPAQPDGWLTVAEAAEYLRCPKSRVYSLVSAKRIPFAKDYVMSKVLFAKPVPEDLAAAWSKWICVSRIA